MPVVEARVTVPLPPDLAFAVSQTSGPVRYRWDPFVRSQQLMDGAPRPAKGVRTLTRYRHGLRMVSGYVSFAPPTNAGMKMVDGPWFFEVFAGGWRFAPGSDESCTDVIWRYSLRCRPTLLVPVADRVGSRLLGREAVPGRGLNVPLAPEETPGLVRLAPPGVRELGPTAGSP